MFVGTLTVRFYAPFVHSLKEKRMVVQSLTGRVKNRWNVSIAEVDAMDTHQTIVLGAAYVSNNKTLAESVLNEILNWMDGNTEAELTDHIIEIL